MFIPMVIAFSVDAKVAMRRIGALLSAEELDSAPEYLNSSPDLKSSIVVKNADFEWNPSETLLSDISLDIPKGSLVAVVGAVGSGKSNLLSGIIGEMRRSKGTVQLVGRAGYCPQQVDAYFYNVARIGYLRGCNFHLGLDSKCVFEGQCFVWVKGRS
jgi:ABC-type transport system involved in cytochrome bd biosynthesis fused ATPase/permease subunit